MAKLLATVFALTVAALLVSPVGCCCCKAAGGGSASPASVDAASAATSTSAHFPPEGTDHLGMKVWLDVDIFGIGKDEVELSGTVAVHRSGPKGDGGREMDGDLIAATLRGNSQVFGEVLAIESPLQRSPCRYSYEGPGRYRGGFEINGWFWLPKHNLRVFSAKPVRVEGTAAGIPPVGQKAELVGGDIALHDVQKPGENAVGVLTRARGEVLQVVDIEAAMKAPETTLPELLKKR